MTLNALLGSLKWYFAEKGLQNQFTALQAFANAAGGSSVTLPGATFGALDLAAATDVSQTPTGPLLDLIPGKFPLKNPGTDRITNTEPTNGFRQ
jgi:hypothetical protein